MVRKANLRSARSSRFAVALFALMPGGCVGADAFGDQSDLPQATYYTVVVRPGDTLSELADRYDSSPIEVARLNRITEESVIHSGQVLRIPVGGEATRRAVLDEASSATTHNYAPPPKPIEMARYDRQEHVSVRSLEPVSVSPLARPRAFATTERSTPRQSLPEMAPRHDASFVWPVAGRVISSFGSSGNGQRNDGINIAAAMGQPIHAAAAGTVTYAGNELKGYGNLVLIQHDDGYVTAYAHAESITVNRGEHVDKGQIIGLTGATGDVDRPQLHFEIRKGVQPIDPRLLLASSG